MVATQALDQDVRKPSVQEIREAAGPVRQVWPRGDFLCGPAPHHACPAIIDVTGRARDLVFGPYRLLSAGVWRARVAVTVCPDAARRQLEVEFGVYPDFTRVSLPYATPGRHEIELIHTFAADGHAEVRVILARAAFHGELAFDDVTVERLGDAPPVASSD